MKHLKNYKLFNEALGIANPTLIFNDIILRDFEKYLIEFQSMSDSKFTKTVKYTMEDLADITSKPDWSKMPVSSMSIDYGYTRMTDEEFSKKYPTTSSIKDFSGTGGCYSIDDESEGASYIKSDNTIHLLMEIGAIINTKFSDIEGLLIETESSITHELNHAYEGWSRVSRGNGEISTDITFALDPNRSKIKKQIWDVWAKNISYILYWSENHEINAMTQDALPYVKRYDIEEMKKKTPSWRFASEMCDFKADKFKKEISDVINKFYPDVNPELILNRLKNGFANELGKSREESILRAVDAPSMSSEKIYKMNIDKFLKLVETRVNKAGDRLKRRILRLYSFE